MFLLFITANPFLKPSKLLTVTMKLYKSQPISFTDKHPYAVCQEARYSTHSMHKVVMYFLPRSYSSFPCTPTQALRPWIPQNWQLDSDSVCVLLKATFRV